MGTDLFLFASQINIFFTPYLINRAVVYFPLAEDATIQNRVVPKWRTQVREAFEKVLPKNGFAGRAVRVIIPDNIVYAILAFRFGMKIGTIQFAPFANPISLIGTLCILFVHCLAMDKSRDLIVLGLLRCGFPYGFAIMTAPRDKYEPMDRCLANALQANHRFDNNNLRSA